MTVRDILRRIEQIDESAEPTQRWRRESDEEVLCRVRRELGRLRLDIEIALRQEREAATK